MTYGSLSWLSGSDARSSHSSVLAVAGSGARDRRWGLKAYPYRAARSVPSGGRRLISRVSNGVIVASASASLARECGDQVRPLHLCVRSGVLIPGHRHRLRRGPRSGLTGHRVERQTSARRADQFGAVAVSQRPGHE